MDWFLYDISLRHERANLKQIIMRVTSNCEKET